MKATIVAAALAAASLSFGGAANAAPVGSIGKAVSTQQTADHLQQVRYRKYHKHRHYHRRGYRHRGYGYYRPYRRPGFGIYIGPRYGYYGYGYGHRRYWR
ncbi:hypothetical protein [Hyphomicrobium sp.]|uniref:hypothetical protein n=1 Tax=Hyphomicrobium sp. TaxID=82 RepID=UPI0025BC363F|nr:hypothetical protein [Hyphomicrobium sp.]